LEIFSTNQRKPRTANLPYGDCVRRSWGGSDDDNFTTMRLAILGGKKIEEYLHDYIKERKQVSIDEIFAICKWANFKQSTAERKLRPDINPEIVECKNNKGFIYAYKIKDGQNNLL
jgi:hypothetical protein